MEMSPAPRHFPRALRTRSESLAVFGDLSEFNARSIFEIIMRLVPPDASFDAGVAARVQTQATLPPPSRLADITVIWRASVPSLSVTVVAGGALPPDRLGNADIRGFRPTLRIVAICTGRSWRRW